MRNLHVRAALLAACAGMLAGCQETVRPDQEELRRPGILQLARDEAPQAESAGSDSTVAWSHPVEPGDVFPPQVIVAPDTVEAGQSFQVTTHTIGPNACWSADSQEARVSEGVVELVPYDVHSGADACGEMLGWLAHTSTLTLDSPGEWTIRVTGRRMRQGDDTWESPVSAERTLLVYERPGH